MFSEDLLAWHDANARDLPWRDERDPYRIWVSEIMLQQTRAETVKAYYRAFLARFPTVQDLAHAPEDEVLKLWEGLGYYSRARNLQKAARMVAASPAGALPDTVEALEKLPGIGAYTAAAIASMAFGGRALAMDGNLIRVLARLFCEERPVDGGAVRRALRERGMALMSAERPGDFNQAMMGLGNLVCVPGRPDCARCPVRAYCGVAGLPLAAELPNLPPKPDKRLERRAVVLVYWQGRVLARRRAASGLLAGLWEFPNFLDARSPEEVVACLAELGVRASFARRERASRHVFTHLIWQMSGFALAGGPLTRSDESLRYVDADELSRLAMPAAMRAFRELAEEALAPRGEGLS